MRPVSREFSERELSGNSPAAGMAPPVAKGAQPRQARLFPKRAGLARVGFLDECGRLAHEHLLLSGHHQAEKGQFVAWRGTRLYSRVRLPPTHTFAYEFER